VPSLSSELPASPGSPAQPALPGAPTPPTQAGTRGELSPVDGLAQLSFLVHGALECRAGEHDVSITLTRLLGVLRDRRPTINELAALLELDKSSTSGLVDRAERRGLVERVPSTTDRRSVRVTLTDAGRDLVARVSVSFEGDVSRLLRHLSRRDREALARLVSSLLVAHASEHGVDLFDTTDAPGSVGQVVR
jgi:MarR family transcriptional regulator, lower aerobic nicotinate degradation pathway regulator